MNVFRAAAATAIGIVCIPMAAHAAPRATKVPVQINEVMFRPPAGQSEWVELTNAGPNAANIRGYVLSDEDGNVYRLPHALPDVPPGAFVLVRFDGLGAASDDVNFNDNVAVLHTPAGLVNVFDDAADQVAFYEPSAGFTQRIFIPSFSYNFAPFNPPLPDPLPSLPPTAMVDFVAWGDTPGDDAATAEAAGVWQREWFVNLYRGLGEASPETLAGPGEPIGRARGESGHSLDAWAVYLASEATPGAQNALAGLAWYYPPSGAQIAGSTFAIGWMPVPGALNYQFQLDDAADFASPNVDTTLSEASYVAAASIVPGVYHWRARANFPGGAGAWSAAAQIEAIALPSLSSAKGPNATSALKLLNIAWQLQHKDTKMLCLDGDKETGANPWDAPHATRGTHANNYCARASASMLASYYGGKLSQDRITYESFKGGPPEADLGHDTPYFLAQTNAAMAWAIGAAIPRTMGKPTFAQIKGWIDGNQPLVAPIPGHVRVIDGYWEFSLGPIGFQLLHVLDPWDAAKWVSYASDPISSYFVGPAGANGAPSVRSDEDADGDAIADTMDDSDGDGLVDFDEVQRFKINRILADSDNDKVKDKADIRGYVFTVNGNYDHIAADLDGDNLRKEVDWDNDTRNNSGAIDGCEDINRDGKTDNAETSNYDPKDDIGIHLRLNWPLQGADVDLHLIRPGGTLNGSGDCYYGNPNPDWGEVGSTCDDPQLDTDCISGCTVENIRLGSPVSGTYSIKVHYYSDHDKGPTSAQVTLWRKGVPQTFSAGALNDGQIWDVGTIQWPSLTFTPSGEVRELSQDERAERRAK